MSSKVAVLFTLFAAALFGTSATSRALSGVESTATGIAAGRLLIGALGLVLVVIISGRSQHLIQLWQKPWIWWMGLAVAGYQALFFIGTDLTGVAIGTVASLALGPLFAGILSWLINGEKPAVIWWWSTALAIAGIAILSFDAATSNSEINLLGVLAAIGAGAAYAGYTVLGRVGIMEQHNSTDVLGAAFLIGGVLLLPAFLAESDSLISGSGLPLLLWLGLFTTTLAYVFFGFGLRQLSASTVATLNLAEPVVATLLGVVVLGERLPLNAVFGIGLIGIALSLLAIATMRVSSK